MASFTDQLVNFNPYIAEVPVDDYTRVGMMKQQQYDQGVQKVQGEIDSVAGLDVVHPEQKAYLQQTVDKLKTQVSGIVSQDFSNQQIVNSVGTLASKMASDPIIQNAVGSTSRYREEVGKQKRAQESGKSSPSNDYVFQKGVHDWLSNKDVTSSYNGGYEEYTDYKKKLVDVLNKELGKPDEKLDEIPYVRDKDGNFQLDKNGSPILDYQKIVTTYKGVSPERIKNIVESTMDEKDKRQLQIDGTYHYRNYDKKALKETTDSSYTDMLDKNNSAIQGLMVLRQTNINNADHIAKIDAQIEGLKKDSENLQNKYKNDISYLDKDPESYKQELFKTNWLGQFSAGLSYAQWSKKFEANPGWIAANKQLEDNEKIREFIIEAGFKEKELGIKEEEKEIKLFEAGLKSAKYGQKAGTGGDISLDRPISNTVSVPEDVAAAAPSTFIAKTLEDKNNIDAMTMQLLAQKGTGLVSLVNDRNPDGTISTRYEWNTKDPKDGHIRTKEEMDKVITEGTNIINTYKEQLKKGEADPDVMDYFRTVGEAKNYNDNATFKAAQILKKADENHNIAPYLKNIPTVTFTSGSDTKYVVTPEDLISLQNKISSIQPKASGGTGGAAAVEPTKKTIDETFITPKEKFLYRLYENQSSGVFNNLLRRTWNAVSPEVAKLKQQKDEEIQTKFIAISPVNQSAEFPIPTGKPELKDRMFGIAKTVQSMISSNPGMSNTGRGFDLDVIGKMLDEKDKGGTNFGLVAKPNGTFALSLHNTSVNPKGSPVEIDLTDAQAKDLFGQNISPSTFTTIRKNLMLTKGDNVRTTNVMGRGAETAMDLQSANLKAYHLKYDVEEPRPGSFQVVAYIHDTKTGEDVKRVLPTKGLVTEYDVTRMLGEISDIDIYNLLHPQKQE